MTRREVREHLFKLVFQKEFYEADLPEQESLYLSEEGLSEDASRKELTERFAQVLAHLEEIDAILSEASVGWKLKRMNKVDLSLLRVAVFEMRFDERVPEKVAINEAVELAKQFGGDDSPAFVNGILAKFAQPQGG